MLTAQYKRARSPTESSESLVVVVSDSESLATSDSAEQIAPSDSSDSISTPTESISSTPGIPPYEDQDAFSVADVEVAPPPYALQPEHSSLSQMRMKRGVLWLFHDAAAQRNTYTNELDDDHGEVPIVCGPPAFPRRRLRLRHDHDPSLRMLLWQACKIELGSVGYYDPYTGGFVTLFNAFKPMRTATGILSQATSLKFVLKSAVREKHRQIVEKRDSGYKRFLRRFYPTRSIKMTYGEDEAIVMTDNSVFRYIEDRAAARMWLSLYFDEIMAVYGHACGLRPEDIVLVTGCLDTSRRVIAVSEPDVCGQLFVVPNANPQRGDAWAKTLFSNPAEGVTVAASGSVTSSASSDMATVLLQGFKMMDFNHSPLPTSIL